MEFVQHLFQIFTDPHLLSLLFPILTFLAGVAVRMSLGPLGLFLSATALVIKMAQYFLEHHPQGRALREKTTIEDEFATLDKRVETMDFLDNGETGAEG